MQPNTAAGAILK